MVQQAILAELLSASASGLANSSCDPELTLTRYVWREFSCRLYLRTVDIAPRIGACPRYHLSPDQFFVPLNLIDVVNRAHQQEMLTYGIYSYPKMTLSVRISPVDWKDGQIRLMSWKTNATLLVAYLSSTRVASSRPQVLVGFLYFPRTSNKPWLLSARLPQQSRLLPTHGQDAPHETLEK